MAKKNQILRMAVPWAIYLTATMSLFEALNIHPAQVPFGIIGWTLIVELPRVILGWFILKPFLGEKK